MFWKVNSVFVFTNSNVKTKIKIKWIIGGFIMAVGGKVSPFSDFLTIKSKIAHLIAVIQEFIICKTRLYGENMKPYCISIEIKIVLEISTQHYMLYRPVTPDNPWQSLKMWCLEIERLFISSPTLTSRWNQGAVANPCPWEGRGEGPPHPCPRAGMKEAGTDESG